MWEHVRMSMLKIGSELLDRIFRKLCRLSERMFFLLQSFYKFHMKAAKQSAEKINWKEFCESWLRQCSFTSSSIVIEPRRASQGLLLCLLSAVARCLDFFFFLLCFFVVRFFSIAERSSSQFLPFAPSELSFLINYLLLRKLFTLRSSKKSLILLVFIAIIWLSQIPLRLFWQSENLPSEYCKRQEQWYRLFLPPSYTLLHATIHIHIIDRNAYIFSFVSLSLLAKS